MGLNNLHLSSVGDVRIGKHVTMELQATSKEKAEQKADTAYKELLGNVIMKGYSFKFKEV